MLQGFTREITEQRSYVELRGRSWLVQALSGDVSDLQTLYESCISGNGRGQCLELLWDAEINGAYLDEEDIRLRIPNAIRDEAS
jgi:hypothetical protein